MSEMAFFLASHGRQKFATSLSMMISAGARLAPSSFPFGRKDAIMMNGGHLIFQDRCLSGFPTPFLLRILNSHANLFALNCTMSKLVRLRSS